VRQRRDADEPRITNLIVRRSSSVAPAAPRYRIRVEAGASFSPGAALGVRKARNDLGTPGWLDSFESR